MFLGLSLRVTNGQYKSVYGGCLHAGVSFIIQLIQWSKRPKRLQKLTMAWDGPMQNFIVIALYKFVKLPHFESLQAPLLEVCQKAGIKGTLLLAEEGINGTVAGTEKATETFLSYLRDHPNFADIVYKKSWASEMPFLRMKVRLKKEIVTMGVPDTDPNKIVGTYVKPKEWNALISDPDVVVIDTRNDYEVEIGSFKGAIDPKTTTFREFPKWVADNKEKLKKPKIAMYCTGGIRCEKSTAYMKSLGYEEVYHLEGGILKYLEDVPAENSLWDGECFVFDSRVSVKHGLEEGSYDQCYGCRWPITEEDKLHPHYVLGVSCPRCYEHISEEKKAAAAERQKQIDLAGGKAQDHMGVDVEGARRAKKRARAAQKEKQANQKKAVK